MLQLVVNSLPIDFFSLCLCDVWTPNGNNTIHMLTPWWQQFSGYAIKVKTILSNTEISSLCCPFILCFRLIWPFISHNKINNDDLVILWIYYLHLISPSKQRIHSKVGPSVVDGCDVLEGQNGKNGIRGEDSNVWAKCLTNSAGFTFSPLSSLQFLSLHKIS